jgi:ribosome-binding factor A
LSHRSQRVDGLIQAELAQIVQREMRDPRARLAVISGIEVSRDLAHAKVRISVLGSDDEREATLAAFDHARGFLRSRLAKSLRLRTVPELKFQLDRGPEHSQRISDLLETLHDDTERS